MLSTHEDEALNFVFFREMLAVLAPLQVHPHVFMSDDASAAFNAFCKTFGPPEK